MKLSKKEIRQKQVRESFIQAAKELILDEGVNEVSVRKVADKVGYSYASIYNHFKDINMLLCYVKFEMTKDIAVYMMSHQHKAIEGVEDIKVINRMHINYFLDNKNIFEFFYNYKLQPFDDEPVYLESIEAQWKAQYMCFVEKGTIKEEDIEIISKTIIYSINGILAILSSNHQLSADDLCRDLDKIVDLLLS